MPNFNEVQMQRMQRKQQKRIKKNDVMMYKQVYALNSEAYRQGCRQWVIYHQPYGIYSNVMHGSGGSGGGGTDWVFRHYLTDDETTFRFVEVRPVNGMKRVFDHGFMTLAQFKERFPQYMK